MIELKITGTDARELFINAAQAFTLLAQGGATMFAAPPAQPDAAPVDPPAPKPQNTPGEAVPVGDVTKLPDKLETARKGTRKAAVTIEAKAETAKTLPEGGDPIPDFKEPVVTELKLEDCRARTRAVIAAFEDKTYAELKIKRAGATQEQIDKVMTATMAFMRELFKPFGIAKAPDLKPEQFAAFMAATEKHL